MQFQLTILVFVVFSQSSGLEITLRQYITTQKKELILQKLSQIQMDAFDNKLVKTQKTIHKRMNKGGYKGNLQIHQFALQSFKEIYDQGSLAYVATVCLGKQCNNGIKQNDKNINRLKTDLVNNSKVGQNVKKQKNIVHRLKQTQKDNEQVDDMSQYHSNRQGLQPNEFRVLLDTGSTNVFLVGNECKSTICENHQKYNEKWQQQQWNTAEVQKIGYISGDTVGKIIYDDLNIGGIDISKQPLFIGSQVSLPIFEGSQWDGVMGLGYWYDKTKKVPDQEKSIIDNIIEQNLIKNRMFTYYIPGENIAKASFGDVVDELKGKLDNSDLVKWSNVEDIDIESQWQIQVYNIKLEKSQKAKAMALQRFSKSNNSQKNKMLSKRIQFQHKLSVFMKKQSEFNNNPCADKGCNLLIDTGTYLNYVPTQWFDKFFPKDMFKVDEQLCKSFDQFPDIVMVFRHSNSKKEYELRMKGTQYMDRIDGKDHMCNPSFGPDTTEDNLITLGQVFLKNFYTIFDFGDKKRIGFYPIESLSRLRK